MWHSWPFFRMACSTLEMALFKVDLSVGRYLALVDDGLAAWFWPELEAEHGRVVGAVARDPRRRGVARRHSCAARSPEPSQPAVDPLSHLQVALLARARAGDSTVGAALMATITGIAAGPGTRVGLAVHRWRRAVGEDAGQRYRDEPHQRRHYAYDGHHHPAPLVATAGHAFTFPVVRELPPVARPGTFDSTW